MEEKPTIDVFRHQKAGDFLILRFGKSPKSGLMVGCGKLIPVSAEEMRSNGLPLVVQYLRGFPTPMAAEKPDMEKFSPRERNEFRRDHKLVNITQAADDVLHLYPMRPKGNGWISIDEQPIEIRLPISEVKFLDALTRAFGLAQ